jgi:hypothetical protein
MLLNNFEQVIQLVKEFLIAMEPANRSYQSTS